jgi:hypothetical protein
MFILYALVLGLVTGTLAGGRLTGLGELQFRWPWVMVGGLFVQVVLFSDAVTSWIGQAGPPIYVVSTAAVIAAVLANHAITGIPVVAVGAVSNFLAIVANGGYMPASPAAVQAQGRVESTAYSNSAVVPDPILRPLTDVFAMPTWLPFANVFSIGDVLIGIGVAIVVVTAMRRRSASNGLNDRPARA